MIAGIKMGENQVEGRPQPLEVLIVDEHLYFCDVARKLLSQCSRFAVVGETYGATEAMELIENLKPDVVLMDVEMEGMNGLEATYLIRDRFPETQVVLMSIYDDKEYSRLALMVGALAFISKKDLSAPVLAQVLSTGSYEALDP